ncbi:hypothetical protein B0H13DRAFT_2377733 [Mycena leptocephala]|nr:hypothetical protein B0H13DRAFT_2377733 [Mycena leptocephala]
MSDHEAPTTQKYKWIWHLIICIVLTVIFVVGSYEATKDLVLGDVDDDVAFIGSSEQQISLSGNYIEVDAILRTVTVDWLPLPKNCSASPEIVVNIFTDPNLLASGGPDGPHSTSRPLTPVFQLNTTEACNRTNYDNFPVFRTVIKLTGLTASGQFTSRQGTLQAYPYDKYFFQISMFAQLASTNASVGLILGSSFGVPINFDVILDRAQSFNDDHGILLNFTISRSAAVVGLVITIVVANWLVTIAFLWITVAAFMWDKEIVAEMFVLPIATLFAFTSVRSNLPGAPAGFGAVVGKIYFSSHPPIDSAFPLLDYYGILPNIGLITLFTAVLLFGVLYRRIAAFIPKRSTATPKDNIQLQACDRSFGSDSGYHPVRD